MSIFFPIGGEETSGSATFTGAGGFGAVGRAYRRGSAAFAGAGALVAVGTVAQRARATFAGQGGLAGVGHIIGHSAAEFAGVGALLAVGHVNAEGNALGRATFAGAGSLAASGRTVLSSGGGAIFSAQGSLSASASVTRAGEFGFTIFVDIVNSSLELQPGTRYKARLTADGVEVPITAFQLRAPRDVIGTSLTLTLARPDPSLISRSSSLKFEIGVRNGATYEWVTLLDGGLLAGRDAQIGLASGRPTDTVQVSALDVLGDRWTLAPARPRTLYNPALISAEEIGAAAGLVKDDDGAAVESFKGFAAPEVLRTEGGAPVIPLRVAVDELSLHGALRAAYVEGCGFTDVVTNIPDFTIARVDFTLEGGYDAGIRPLLALYEPLYFAGDNNSLWIIDPDEVSIASLAPRQLPLSAVVTVKQTKPVRQIVDGLIVSYLEADGGEFVTGDRFETETSADGRTSVRRRIRQFANASAPGVVTREVTTQSTTTVRGETGDIVHRETQADTFDALNRKSGHTRTVESLVPDLEAGGEVALLTTNQETCAISYRAHPTQARSYVQNSSITQMRGLIHVDNDNQYRDEPFRLPLTEAHRNGMIDSSADQTSSFGLIKTTMELLNVRDDGELDVNVIVIDEIAKTTERSSSTPRVGAIGGDTRRNSVRRVLLYREGVETITRRVPEVSGGDLPREVVLPLGRRKLNRLNDPPDEVSIGLPGIELDIRRGSIVEAYDRAGADGVFITEAYQITGNALGSADQYISMSLDAVKAASRDDE